MLRTRTARCDSPEITCFTLVVREICSSNNQEISSWNRWNDRLSLSLWSLKSPTSICRLVGKGVLPGAVQEKIQVEAKWHELNQERIQGISGGHATWNSLCQERPYRSKRGFWRWCAVQKYQSGPVGLAAWSRKRYREQSAVGYQSCRSGRTSSTADNRGAVATKSLHQANSGIGEVRVHGPVHRCM